MVDNHKMGDDRYDLNLPPPNSSLHPEMTIGSSSEKKNESFTSSKSSREMCSALFKCISDDALAADAKWSLFIAACQSYRYDSCLKPFPPMFLTPSNEKDINLLLKTIDTIPAFSLLKKFFTYPDKFKLDDSVVNLMYWVLIQLHEPSLKSVPKIKHPKILKLVPSELEAQKPDYIFKVKYPDNSANNIKWQNYKHNYATLHAFHGSRLENFHSIFHYGLQSSLTKTPLFGQGVYLSSELLVSLPYSSTGFGWGKSLMGAELSVIALCEVLDHPSVHCQKKGGENNRNRSMANDSLAGEVPHKYYVVANSELVRVQYLLVYSRSPPAPMLVEGMQRSSVLGWMKKHKLLTAIMGYIVLLASVGLSNNPNVLRYYNIIMNKAGFQ